MTNNFLNEQEIRTYFGKDAGHLTIQLPKTVSSTNDLAKKQLLEVPDKLNLVATNHQTAGRGRQGKSFYSSLKHGLYFSVALEANDENLENVPLYTLLAAAALVEVLDTAVEKPLAIKWVNDLFYNGRKISGILSELVPKERALKRPGIVVGIGLNFAGSFQAADQETQNVAGTLFGEELPETFNQNQFLGEFLNVFYAYHRNFHKKAFMAVYESHLMGVGRKVTYHQSNRTDEGIIQGINDKGHLLVKKADGSLEALYGQAIHFSSSQFTEK